MRHVHREIIRHVQRCAPEAKFELISEKKHLVFRVTYLDKTFKVSFASSPKNPDLMVRNACVDVCVKLGVPKPIF